MAINKNKIEDILENKNVEIDNKNITKKANLEIFISSFFPNQIKTKLLNRVADA